VSGLWTESRDALVKALQSPPAIEIGCDVAVEGYPGTLADHLIDTGAVCVLDPDNSELVEWVARKLYRRRRSTPWDAAPELAQMAYRLDARTFILDARVFIEKLSEVTG
jgi:hypothetical protein